MAQITAVVTLSVVLALSTLVWKNWDSRMPVGAGAGPRSLAIADVMQKVDAKALPQQQIDDRTMVFSDEHDR